MTKPANHYLRALALATTLVVVPMTVESMLAQTKANRPPAATKHAALDNIAKAVLVPAQASLALRSADLAAAVDALAGAPGVPSLKKAQLAWKETLLAWRRTQAFAHGPLADLGFDGRIQFWPARRQSVDRVLTATRGIDDGYVQELGAGVVGLSGLEVLLFDPRLDDTGRVASFSGPSAERQRQYARAIARDLVAKTRHLDRAWQGPAGYGSRFAASGQQQLNLLVNDMLIAIESGAQLRLQNVIDHHGEPQFPLEVVEGSQSGTSQEGLVALLVGVRTAFAGGEGAGLDDYLSGLNAPSAKRVDLQFQKTIAAVQAIGLPLEQGMRSKPQAIQVAADECRKLEVLLKVEVVSALGVTLTFKSTDGD